MIDICQIRKPQSISIRKRSSSNQKNSSNNGRVLRRLNTQQLVYVPLKGIISSLKSDNISFREIDKSIRYLSQKGYIQISRNKRAAKIATNGIYLLAGSLQDNKVMI